MTAARDYEETRAQLRHLVAEPAPGILLLEFATIPQLDGIARELRAIDPDRPVRELLYDPSREDAVRYLERARREMADIPPDALPLLLLRPAALPDPAADLSAATDFWRATNFRRETWGGLPAQILLCVDPWHLRRVIEQAPDLLSWAMPKLHLLPPADLAGPAPESLPALSSFAEYQMSPQMAESQWQALWPVLEEKASRHAIEPGDFRRYVFPLLEAGLSAGNLVRARQVRDAACDGPIPPGDKVEWHKLNVRLACGAADYPSAEEHARQILRLLENSPDKATRLVAEKALADAASLLMNFGQYVAAEHLFRRLLVIDESHHGKNHPNTLGTRNNVAAALQEQNRHEEAEKELRNILRKVERVRGREHPDTLKVRSNLAKAITDQGRHDEAAAEHQAILAIRERVLGPEHTDTLKSGHDAAASLHDLSWYSDAESEFRKVLSIRKRVLGPEHPDVFFSFHTLALNLGAQGKLPEALLFAQRAEQGWHRVLGEGHPDTQSAKKRREAIEAEIQGQQASEPS